MMATLNEEKVKLIFSYSITGLTEGKDYNITIRIENRKILFNIFYFNYSSQTQFTVKNKVNFVSVGGQPLSNQNFNPTTRLLQA